MKILAISKYVRVTPRKMKVLADTVKEMTPVSAAASLSFMPQSGAMPLQKVIQSAVNNAKNKGISEANLRFDSIQILPGATMKRFRAVSRGMAHTYKKRMSHIKVILSDEPKYKLKARQNAKIKLQNENVKLQNEAKVK